jgi:hypothetical protein
MRIARTSNSEKDDHANDDFIASHDVHVRDMLRTRSSDLFVSRQARNYLRQLRLIRVASAIEQRQRNDDTTHEDTKSRSAYRLRGLSSHFSENIERENARSIHSSSSVSSASYSTRSIE